MAAGAPGPVISEPVTTITVTRHEFTDRAAKYVHAVEQGAVITVVDDNRKPVIVLCKPLEEPSHAADH